MEVSIVMGVPLYRWMVYFMENPMTRGTHPFMETHPLPWYFPSKKTDFDRIFHNFPYTPNYGPQVFSIIIHYKPDFDRNSISPMSSSTSPLPPSAVAATSRQPWPRPLSPKRPLRPGALQGISWENMESVCGKLVDLLWLFYGQLNRIFWEGSWD